MSGRTMERYPRCPDWRLPCANKREKKLVLEGRKVQGHQRRRQSLAARPLKPTEGLEAKMESLSECLAGLSDPRIDRRRRHLLIDIVVIAVCAVMANADTWKDMAVWAKAREEWLRRFLALPNGTPSRDTLRRTISRLDPDPLQRCFLRWLRGLRKQLGGVVSIDGKTLRRSKQAGVQPLHIVSVWASEQHLTLGQRRVDGKSNEITAIPELLQLLEIKGAIVTIDAMGCQKEIAKKIIERGADYSLAVKGNQETLADDVRAAFAEAMERGFAGTSQQESHVEEKGHGRKERRSYYVMPVPDSLRTADQWPGLKSAGMLVSYRSEEDPGEVRYYINSFACDVHRFAHAVRLHWGIENSLHWVMDVTLREDESRIRKDHGGDNVSWLRRIAITIIKQDTTSKDTIRGKRVRAAYDADYLATLLDAIPLEN